MVVIASFGSIVSHLHWQNHGGMAYGSICEM